MRFVTFVGNVGTAIVLVQLEQGVQQHIGSLNTVLRRGVFGLGVADAALTRDKDHTHVGDAGDILSVMTSTAGQRTGAQSEVLAHLGNGVVNVGANGNGGVLKLGFEGDMGAGGSCDRSHRLRQS